MSEPQKPKTPKEIIDAHDLEARIKAEADILQKAHLLTNGGAGNEKLLGEVMEWVVKELIELGLLVRVSVKQQDLMQLKTECVMNHRQKNWVVKAFGVSYALPASVAVVVIAALIYLACHAQGLM